MSRTQSPIFALFIAAAVATGACSSTDENNSDGGPAADATAPAADAAPFKCTNKPWTKGTVAFKDVTKAWKLDAIGAAGARLAVGDIDGDGWPDLVVNGAKSYVLRNTGKGTFTDATSSSKIYAARSGTTARKGPVVSFADIDNDGDLDVYTGTKATSGGVNEVMINDGKGVFSFGPATNGIRSVGVMDEPAGAAFTDFDRDGKLDVWIPQASSGAGRQDRLYRGDGKGLFTEVTKAAGLTTAAWSAIAVLNGGKAHSRAWGALACDLNNDGWPELLTPAYGRSPNHLWQAKRSGATTTFTNRGVASGYAFDTDKTWTDNQFARCYCASNRTLAECKSVAAPLISCTRPNWTHRQDREAFRLGGNSASTSCADLNNDGYMDLVTGEIRHWWAGKGSDGSEVLVNDGKKDVSFTRPGDEKTGLAVKHSGGSWDEGHMTQNVLDFDNDGLLDIYQGASDYPSNQGLLYHQVGGANTLRFELVDKKEGIDHHRSHGVVAADFDRDGDLDLVVGHSRARCNASAPANCYATAQVRLFENVIGNRSKWVQLELVGNGTDTNTAAIGARVEITACGFSQTREVIGGYGHFGAQDDLVVHAGVRDAPTVNVTITWPNEKRTKQTFELATNKRYRVEQGKQPTEAKK